MSSKQAIIITIAGVMALAATLVLLAVKQDRDRQAEQTEMAKRIGDNVIATFAGGEVVANELRQYINDLTSRQGKHAVCDKHGYNHSKCSSQEDCETHPLDSVEAYRFLLKQLVMEKMLDRWIREKGMTTRKDVKHRLKHLVEEINLGALAGQMHADKLKPDKLEIRQYYQQRKADYKGRAFDEVEKEIESVLVAQKQAEYIPKYIEQLKANAVIERNYELLRVPEPSETEIRSYYESHRKEYMSPEFVRVLPLRISAADEKSARQKADKALARLRAGDDFEAVVVEFADGGSATARIVKRSQQSGQFEQRVFRRYPGEFTPVFADGGFFYIVKILERKAVKQQPLSAVMPEVRDAVRRRKEQEKLKLNKYEALFSIHGKRFTVEQFQQEFSELTAAEQKQFASFEAKKNILDQLIVKELLMEKAEDKAVDAEQRKETEQLKRRALQQMLHKEEVDEKVEVSAAEAMEFYDKQKRQLMEPAKAKVDIIRVGVGFSEDERKRARKKIEAAQAKLAAGEAFAKVAGEYSEDWTATRGGEMDRWIYEGGSHLDEPAEHDFHRHVFGLKAGEISDFFEFSNNFWIIRLREHQPSRQQTFEEARPSIEAFLKQMKHQQRMFELQNELLEKSQLVIRDFVLSRMLQIESKRHEAERGLY